MRGQAFVWWEVCNFTYMDKARTALTRELKALELDVDCKDLHLACKDIILFQ